MFIFRIFVLILGLTKENLASEQPNVTIHLCNDSPLLLRGLGTETGAEMNNGPASELQLTVPQEFSSTGNSIAFK